MRSVALDRIAGVKHCPRYNVEKPLESFGLRSDRPGQPRPWCKECTATAARQWQHDHADQHRASKARWNRENLERVRATAAAAARRRYAENPEPQAAATRRWLAKNPERITVYNHRRLARLRNAPGVVTAEQLRARWDYYGGRCWMCGDQATDTDHVIPLSRGGANWPSNLRPACGHCNGRKWAHDWRVIPRPSEP